MEHVEQEHALFAAAAVAEAAVLLALLLSLCLWSKMALFVFATAQFPAAPGP